MAINVFVVSGNCGSDMEVRRTQSGKAIGQFSLPVKSGYGEHEKTSWVTCKVLGERADKLAQYITKGSAVTVTGSFVLEEWESNGTKHSRPVIIVDDLQLPPANKQGNQGGQQQQRAPQHQNSYQLARQQPQAQQDWDDSVPF